MYSKNQKFLKEVFSDKINFKVLRDSATYEVYLKSEFGDWIEIPCRVDPRDVDFLLEIHPHFKYENKQKIICDVY